MNLRCESWGRFPQLQPAQVVSLRDRNAPLPASSSPLLAYGNGRSYGDSCQNQDGILLLTRGLDRFMSFDRETGILRCEAGVLFDEILRLIVPAGWFLPVTPGTRWVTVGGAIANDVHGKNHHRAGCLGRHVRRFELLRSDGNRRQCSPTQSPELFAATIGGLGLTGLVTWAELQLVRIPGQYLSVETLRFHDLAEFDHIARASVDSHEFTVAWIDCLAPSSCRGRGLFTRGNFSEDTTERLRPVRDSMRIPFSPRCSLLSGPIVRGLNRLYYRLPTARRRRQHYVPFFYPLDRFANWNLLYGPRGFVQHQSVLPPYTAAAALQEMLDTIAADGSGSFLAVLKTLGDLPSPGMLSFPRAGTTLALDFPWQGNDTVRLLDRLADIVDHAGGALYPAKDALMSGIHFRRFFPSWREFSRHVDPAFSSSFWRRVTAESE